MVFVKVTAIAFTLALLGGTAVEAATVGATSASFASVFAHAKAGDTIVLSGKFAATTLLGRSFATTVTIDARAATFTDTFTIKNSSGLTVLGGHFGSATGQTRTGTAVAVYNGDHISFIDPVVVGDGSGAGHGIAFSGTSNATVTGGQFSGLRLGLGIQSLTNATVSGNSFTGETSDGINIADSHLVTASGNICSGSVPSAGAHPDCIQLWSLIGKPIQSDIRILDNQAYGDTQGFTSFNPGDASGLRIQISGNYLDVSQPQGIACYGCFDSMVTDNVLATIPGSRWQSIIRVIGGANNIVSGNTIGDLTPAAVSALARTGPAGARSTAAAMALAAAVPEPLLWAQLLAGFGLVGAALRRLRPERAA